jgi:hypothetical protein
MPIRCGPEIGGDTMPFQARGAVNKFIQVSETALRDRR